MHALLDWLLGNPWRALRGQTLLLNLKSGSSLRGTLWRTVGRRGQRHLVVKDCVLILQDTRSTRMAEARVAAVEVDWYQVIMLAEPADRRLIEAA